MKKVKEFISEHINKGIGSLAVLAFAGLATVGYWFCDLLGVNEIYCNPLIIRSELFLIGGVLIRVAWRRSATWLLCAAVALVIILPIVSRLAPLPRTPEEIIEFLLVAPFQAAVGVILAEILIWIWANYGSIFKASVRKTLGLTGDSGKADATGTS
jgi:fucose 4-O-acetylase-like acetyltransferase